MSTATTTSGSTPHAQADERDERAVPRYGWWVVARKEFADQANSVRLLIVMGLLALAAVGTVAAAAGSIQDVATEASRDPSIFLRLFVLPLEGTPFSFVTLVALVGPLLGIAFGFDAINAERAARTLPRLVSQPIHRDDVVNGKFVAGLMTIGLVVTGITVVTAAVGVLRLGITPSPAEGARLLAWMVLTIIYIAVWLAFALACSVYLRKSATSALVALATWVVLSLFATFLIDLIATAVAPVPAEPTLAQVQANANWTRWLGLVVPGSLYQDVTSVLLTPEIRSLGFSLSAYDPRALPSSLPLFDSLAIAWPQVATLVGMTVAIFLVAYIRFMREEVRA